MTDVPADLPPEMPAEDPGFVPAPNEDLPGYADPAAGPQGDEALELEQ